MERGRLEEEHMSWVLSTILRSHVRRIVRVMDREEAIIIGHILPEQSHRQFSLPHS